MSNEESLIPSVESFITPLMAVQTPLYISNLWFSAMKAYGEEVRRITLEEVVKSKIKIIRKKHDVCGPSVMSCSFPECGCTSIFIDSDSILQLNQSERLKIS